MVLSLWRQCKREKASPRNDNPIWAKELELAYCICPVERFHDGHCNCGQLVELGRKALHTSSTTQSRCFSPFFFQTKDRSKSQVRREAQEIIQRKSFSPGWQSGSCLSHRIYAFVLRWSLKIVNCRLPASQSKMPRQGPSLVAFWLFQIPVKYGWAQGLLS